MRICLATRPAEPGFTPLALLYLRAFLIEREGWAPDEVRLLEAARDATGAAIAEQILAHEPALVGLSCYYWNVGALHEAAARIKAARPETVVVLGGPEVGPVARDVLTHRPAVDAIVRSEGEVPFGAIARTLRDRGDLRQVPGLTLRHDGAIVETPDAEIVMRLDDLPSPHKPEYGDFRDRHVCIETQRGCVFRCNFCFYNKDLSIRNRRFDLDRVKREILFWLERRPDSIYLMDPIFNLNAARAKEICRFIAEHNTARVPLHSEIWAEFVDEEMAALFKAAHFTFMEVGLQTTDEHALNVVERRLRMQPFQDGIRYLKQYDIPFELQLIHGLPEETPESFRRSLRFAAALDPPMLSVFNLLVLPGTELWRKAPQLGLTFDPEPPYELHTHPTMDADELAWGRRLSMAVMQVGNARTLRMLAREDGLSLLDVLEDWMARNPGPVSEADRNARAKAFVRDFCEAHAIPAEFYTGFAGWEFRD
ncbi:MAG: radical SAM protein [Vicinamibacterales bacterium]